MGHTPGPWTIGGVPGNEGEAREIAASGRMVAWTASSWDDDAGDVVTEEDEANAALIAAAPELLRALKATHGWLAQLSALVADGNLQAAEDWVAGNSDWIAFYEDQNDGIIAKAEGRDE